MNRSSLTSALVLAGLLAGGASAAQELDPELTMTMIPDAAGELPESVMHEIELPAAAAEDGARNSADGLATANENRSRAGENRAEALERAARRREAGLDVAADARERGAELGAEIAEAAAAGREHLIRGDVGLELPIPGHLPDLPGHAGDGLETPDAPELPDRPGPPGNVPAGP